METGGVNCGFRIAEGGTIYPDVRRDRRGGVLAARWNLILPEALTRLGEPDER